MLNNIKTLKRYCRATLSVFSIKKNDDDNILLNNIYGKFFMSNRNFTA